MKKSLILLSAVLSLGAVHALAFAAEDGTEDVLPPAPPEMVSDQLVLENAAAVSIPKDQEAAVKRAMEEEIPAPPAE